MSADTVAGASRGNSPDRLPRELWVLVVGAFLIALGYGLISPVLPRFATSFGVGATAASAVVSAFAVFRLLFAPASGRLVQRLGERWVYLTGLVVVALSSAATAFASDYWQLLILRGVGGVGSTMFTVSAASLIVRLALPQQRGRATSAYASAFLLGGVLGPVVGGSLGGLLGLRAPFLVYAALLLVASVVVFTQIGDVGNRPPPDAPARLRFGFKNAVHDSAYRAALVSGFSNGWCNFGVRNALLPLLAVQIVGAQQATWAAGIALATFAGGNAAGLLSAGSRSDHFGRKPLILGSLLVSAVSTAATGLVPNLEWLLVACAIAGVGAGVLNPTQQASVADVIGRERSGGPALAAFQMFADTGSIIGPLIGGLLVDHGSFGLAFGLSGATALVAVLPWLRARETRPDLPE